MAMVPTTRGAVGAERSPIARPLPWATGATLPIISLSINSRVLTIWTIIARRIRIIIVLPIGAVCAARGPHWSILAVAATVAPPRRRSLCVRTVASTWAPGARCSPTGRVVPGRANASAARRFAYRRGVAPSRASIAARHAVVGVVPTRGAAGARRITGASSIFPRWAVRATDRSACRRGVVPRRARVARRLTNVGHVSTR